MADAKTLSNTAEQKPSNEEMIKAMQGKAPEQAVMMFTKFGDVQWRTLNSYVHGGIHVLQRHGAGYPEQLIKKIVKSSNGLLSMAAILTGNQVIAKDISRIQRRHEECLPVLLT